MDLNGFVEMEHQVGGHVTSMKSHKGRIIKPFQSNRRGEREYEFYERVFVAEKEVPEFKRLQGLLPEYHGTILVSESQDEEAKGMLPGQYLVLEDLTWQRQWPCIMDVKMGTRSYEDDATAEKIVYEKSKFPLQEEIGFRIQGIKVYDPKKGQYVEFDKHFGRSIKSADALAPAFRNYFPTDNASKAIALLQAFLRRLEQFQAWFDEQERVEFIASSFLFLYNGEASDNGDPYAADIRLIDFAHVTEPNPPKRDEGVRKGIATLLQCFQALLDQVQAQ